MTKMTQKGMISAVLLTLLGSGGLSFYQIKSAPKLVVVNLEPLVGKVSADLARKSMNSLNQGDLKKEMIVFKEKLMRALDQFAEDKKVIVANSVMMHGSLPDMTKAFEDFWEKIKP